MSSSIIDKLKNTLGMGARTNKYQIIINGSHTIGEKGDILAISTTLPGRAVNEIGVWNQGRLTMLAGSADFSGTWSVTFKDDEEHSLRATFLEWFEFIDSVVADAKGAEDHKAYMSEAIINQLSTIDNSVTASYVLEDVWPKSISDSSYADANSDIIEFTVDFNYSNWHKA